MSQLPLLGPLPEWTITLRHGALVRRANGTEMFSLVLRADQFQLLDGAALVRAIAALRLDGPPTAGSGWVDLEPETHWIAVDNLASFVTRTVATPKEPTP